MFKNFYEFVFNYHTHKGKQFKWKNRKEGGIHIYKEIFAKLTPGKLYIIGTNRNLKEGEWWKLGKFSITEK